MQFFKTIHKNELVFVINEKKVDDILACQIISQIPLKKRVGLDMSQVLDIDSPILIDYLLQNKIKLFNLKSEVLAYLSLILKDGFLKSYINYSDFSQDKRELIKRKFLIA
jgi:hypothetical protein